MIILTEADKELELLLSEKEVKFGDKDVVVKKLSMLDTIRIASNLSSVVANMMSNSDAVSGAIAKIGFKSEDNSGDESMIRVLGFVEILGLIGDEGVDLLKSVIDKSTTLTPQEIEDIDLIDGIDLIQAIYEVNKGFFKKCGKKLEEKMAKINKELAPTEVKKTTKK